MHPVDIKFESFSQLTLTHIRNNSYVSQRHKLLYLATPKVACTGLKWWFAELVGVSSAISQSLVSMESDTELVIHDSFAREAPEYTGANKAVFLEALSSPDYFRFCLVRNPYTRVFSAWQSKWLLCEPLQFHPYLSCDAGCPIESVAHIRAAFESFVKVLSNIDDPAALDAHVAPQVLLLDPQKVAYTAIGRIESPSPLVDALAEWIGPGFHNPLVGSRANASLLPYSSAWISDEAAQLIRTIYACDFETFGYDTLVPPGAAGLEDGALAVALRSIKLLRNRNARIGELIGRRSSVSQEVPAAVSTMHIFWAEDKGGEPKTFSAQRSECTSYSVDGIRQQLTLVFPENVSQVVALRFAPSSQPVALLIHMISIVSADGNCLWCWGESEGDFEAYEDILVRSPSTGLLIICLSADPRCTLNIPDEVLASIGCGAQLTAEVTPWHLHEAFAEVLKQHDLRITDVGGSTASGQAVGAVNLTLETQPSVSGILKGLDDVAALLASNSAKQDQLVAVQSARLLGIQNEMQRAEAQLDILKELMIGGRQTERL